MSAAYGWYFGTSKNCVKCENPQPLNDSLVGKPSTMVEAQVLQTVQAGAEVQNSVYASYQLRKVLTFTKGEALIRFAASRISGPFVGLKTSIPVIGKSSGNGIWLKY